jgi:hypothetical protein
MNSETSQIFESYVPVYDAIPESWEEAKPFLVENLKKISNAVNIREIGWFLDEELLSGKAFYPGVSDPNNNVNPQFRQILRKVIDLGALVVGVNPGVNHGIVFDNKFQLIQMWVSGTNTGTLIARTIGGNSVLMTSTQILVISTEAYDKATCVIEYIQEI